MSKRQLKKEKFVEQKFKDGLTGEKFTKEEVNNPSLVDSHRNPPKREGTRYQDKAKVIVTKPLNHMKEHKILRIRTPKEDELKTMIDARKQVMKFRNSCNNRISSYKRRTDHLDTETLKWLEEQSVVIGKKLTSMDSKITRFLKGMGDKFADIAIKLTGVGPVTIAHLITYIDIKEARYASSLWKYAGYHVPAHQRYVKGESGGGNQTLRTALFAFAEAQIKISGRIVKAGGEMLPYVKVYYNEKKKLEISELEVLSRPVTGKEMIKMKWKDVMPVHRHQAAIRKMLKHFLADCWKVWRTIEGLETPNLWIQEKAGHTGIVQPEERGWVYEKP